MIEAFQYALTVSLACTFGASIPMIALLFIDGVPEKDMVAWSLRVMLFLAILLFVIAFVYTIIFGLPEVCP